MAFKIGDRVKRVSTSSDPALFGVRGEEYTVLDIADDGIIIKPNGHSAESDAFIIVQRLDDLLTNTPVWVCKKTHLYVKKQEHVIFIERTPEYVIFKKAGCKNAQVCEAAVWLSVFEPLSNLDYEPDWLFVDGEVPAFSKLAKDDSGAIIAFRPLRQKAFTEHKVFMTKDKISSCDFKGAVKAVIVEIDNKVAEVRLVYEN